MIKLLRRMLNGPKRPLNLPHSAATPMTLEEAVRIRLPQNTQVDFRLDNDSIKLETIADGIVFIMAIWSGTCRSSLAVLSSALTSADPNSTIPLFVVDTEDCLALTTHPGFAGKLGGNGETAWYKGGKQIGFSSRGNDPAVYVANTKKLTQPTKPSDAPQSRNEAF